MYKIQNVLLKIRIFSVRVIWKTHQAFQLQDFEAHPCIANANTNNFSGELCRCIQHELSIQNDCLLI